MWPTMKFLPAFLGTTKPLDKTQIEVLTRGLKLTFVVKFFTGNIIWIVLRPTALKTH